ncbi:MAG: ATP-dependent helicase HrpB [Tabrizicola sp.]|uniref:ATP-dependent helicase HrpB n=1 Tax=Tabrizicola sp. TaxID=2005166 RepID=UPI002733FD8A|nr:ATP-dependent helicase HrpB [Tabrizicola sp.]MDP3264343.1 ATP-dependent helicase HrpB [Tabrizicola sp.]MDP3648612.1 ATP-dependent helicase HrpB [Paracoccaceae bacterium]
MADLPVTSALPALRDAIAARGMAVLQAPPGAGKTTLVPLDLLASGLVAGRILLLEPRRLAARAAAERMAETLGEKVGQTVGYRIRGEARVSAATRIEVVTEGILTRMIQSDPGLEGTGLVIFDEFHERSLHADLGLALCLEVRGALRPDLLLLVMSATLDAAPVAALMGAAPMVTSEGRAYPVETRWLPRPPDASLRLEAVTAAAIRAALGETEGGILVFLPGEGEIRRTINLLGDLPGCTIRPLFGAMDFTAQRAALAPAVDRKIVLATAIAETSLTLPDIRVVIDAGHARRARFDPASGMSRLVTERVTKAEAEQRRGRAGRVAAGICYRLWSRGEEGGLAPFPPAEIEVADLAPLALDLAEWGSADLPFLTAPREGPLAEARALLTGLGALDDAGRITPHGKALARLPLHPRLGHMLTLAGPKAAPLAALLAERDPLRAAPPDLALRLKAVDRPGPEAHMPTIQRIRDEARRLAAGMAKSGYPDFSPAQMAALAYPDRIGLRRKGDAPRWVLSGGKGAVIAPGTPLATARLIVATDLDGDPREATIRQAAALTEAEVREVFADRITWVEVCEWSRREARVLARRQERFGALVLDDRPWPDAPPDRIARAELDGLRLLGLPWTPAARRLRARAALARSDDWPEVSDAALLASADGWLLAHLAGRRSAADLAALDLTEPLKALLGWDRLAILDRLVPASFTTPLGRAVPIDYDGDAPAIEVRLQEMFGVTTHPLIGAARQPLRITLLSPARAPVQVTTDLPRFWATSYADVRKDMRGAYPRHPWPEDPTVAEPTLKAKPRGT